MNNETTFLLSLFKSHFPEATKEQTERMTNLFEHAFLAGSLQGMLDIAEIENAVMCPRCHELKKSKEDKDFIREFHSCLACDHTMFE